MKMVLDSLPVILYPSANQSFPALVAHDPPSCDILGPNFVKRYIWLFFSPGVSPPNFISFFYLTARTNVVRDIIRVLATIEYHEVTDPLHRRPCRTTSSFPLLCPYTPLFKRARPFFFAERSENDFVIPEVIKRNLLQKTPITFFFHFIPLASLPCSPHPDNSAILPPPITFRSIYYTSFSHSTPTLNSD